jgi:hypothetical protein
MTELKKKKNAPTRDRTPEEQLTDAKKELDLKAYEQHRLSVQYEQLFRDYREVVDMFNKLTDGVTISVAPRYQAILDAIAADQAPSTKTGTDS